MQTIRRVLIGVALLVWLAIPAISNGGGENAGGTGVWILPRAMPLCAGGPPAVVRDLKTVTNLGQDVVMEVSTECGAAVATFVDEITGVATALPVSGALVRLPSNLLQAMAATACPKANIVVSDSNQVGYLFELTVVPGTGAVAITVR